MPKDGNTQRRRIPLLGIELPSLKEGSFASNISFISGRNAVTLVTQLVFTPLIMHLYDPAAYGTMGAVLALSAFLLPFATLQYDRAMLLAQDERDLLGLRALGNLLSLATAVLVLLIIIIGGGPLLEMLGLEAVGKLIYLAPLVVLLTAWAQVSQQMVYARMRYKQSFVLGSINAVGNKLTAIFYALLFGGGGMGLLSAEILSRSVQLVFNRRSILKEKKLLSPLNITYQELTRTAHKYQGFPKYELPAVGVAALANQIPLWWIPKHFGIAAFGQFSIAMALLEMPMRLLGSSMSSTFYQKAARTYTKEGPQALARITRRLMWILSAIGLLPFLVIALTAKPIFAWLFQDRWLLAGSMISFLSIFYYFRLVAEPVSSVFRVLGQQRTYLWIHGLFLFVRGSAMVWAIVRELELLDAIAVYAAANAAGYAMQIILILHALRTAEDRSSLT